MAAPRQARIENVREYRLHLIARGLKANSINPIVGALRFSTHDARTQGYRRSVTVRAQGRHAAGRALARRGAASVEGGVQSQDAKQPTLHLRGRLACVEVVA